MSVKKNLLIQKFHLSERHVINDKMAFPKVSAKSPLKFNTRKIEIVWWQHVSKLGFRTKRIRARFRKAS